MIINLEYIFSFLLNYILISVPQEVMGILIILFLLKEYNYFKRENFKRTLLDVFFIAGMQSAFFMNYLFYFTNLSLPIRLACNVIIFFAFVSIFLKSTIKEPLWKEHLNSYSPESPTLPELPEKYRSNISNGQFRRETSKYVFTIEKNVPSVKYKNKKGIFVFSLCMIILINILDFSMILYLQYMFDFDFTTLSSNIFNSMLLFCPQFIILVFGIYLIYIYANTRDVTIFKIWRSNKKFRILTLIQSITTITFTIVIYLFYNKTNFFKDINPDIGYVITMGLYTLLILHVIVPWALICKKEVEKYKAISHSNNFS